LGGNETIVSIFYLCSIFGEMEEFSEKACVFCEIVGGRVPSHKIYEDDLTLCILDINPLSRGQSLVIPKRHVPWWHELSLEENASLFRVAKIVAEKMMHSLQPDFVCMYARGRRIPHTHIFLVPTYSGDVLDRFFNALELFQESPKRLAALSEPRSMEETADSIRKAGIKPEQGE
jgi:histidine triad (HIT) family protein